MLQNTFNPPLATCRHRLIQNQWCGDRAERIVLRGYNYLIFSSGYQSLIHISLVQSWGANHPSIYILKCCRYYSHSEGEAPSPEGIDAPMGSYDEMPLLSNWPGLTGKRQTSLRNASLMEFGRAMDGIIMDMLPDLRALYRPYERYIREELTHFYAERASLTHILAMGTSEERS
jgi:hypothetical protein